MFEDVKPTAEINWALTLTEILPLFGHRNWIVVADSAYPAQSSPGITTLVADSDHIEVLRTILHSIDARKHVRAKVYTDAELGSVAESDAPGVSELRNQMNDCLYGHQINSLPHESIIAKLGDSARVFQVFIVKTPLTIPYTSVFLELECGYWSDAAETRLRAALRNSC